MNAHSLARPCLAALALCLLAVSSPAGAQESIDGEWDVTVDWGGRSTFATLELARGADSAYSGHWGSSELQNVRFDGKKLTFDRTMRFGDQEFKLSCDATLADGKLSGKITSERGDLPFTAARPRPSSPLLGRWSFHYVVGDREIDATLVVIQKDAGTLEGQWTSSAGEHVISALKLDGSTVTFARKSKFAERELSMTFEGRLDGNQLDGKFKSDRGEIEARARRHGGDLVGTWELTTTTEQGTRTSLLKIQGDLGGRYELFGGEFPIKELKLDGDKVSFRVEMGFGDLTFTIDFQGKLEGGTLKAQVTSPRGTREVTGKKREPAPAKAPSAKL